MKRCFKCGRMLPLDDFYRHPQMADGHLNKCKQCTKRDVKEKYIENSQEPAYMEKERARGREKFHRLGYRNSEQMKEKRGKFHGFPNTKRFFESKGYVFSSDVELHHWNYNASKSVIVLPRRLHHRLHNVIRLDMLEGIYYHGEEKLDTLQKHLSVLKSTCEEFGYDFSQISVLSPQSRKRI